MQGDSAVSTLAQGTLPLDNQSAHEVSDRFRPIITHVSNDPVPTYIWDIPYTIPQLGYLTHSHFRYYGKFPPPIAAQLLTEFPPPEPSDYVLDNFAGSGTTLVEAKLRGINCYGVDVSWLACISSNVKTRYIDLDRAESLFKASCARAHALGPLSASGRIVEKWYECENAQALASLQHALRELDRSPERDFVLTAFLAILRRVSKAYDGEVRPRINKTKRRRDVYKAFHKKFYDMIKAHRDFMAVADPNSSASCVVGDSRSFLPTPESGNCHLVISHPPYLNSFDYSPVFSLEYYWGQPFAGDFASPSIDRNRSELRAYPANADITNRYYAHLEETYRQTYRHQVAGGRLAVVIGDCTRKGVLEPVVDNAIRVIEHVGYTLSQINLRTTHYGLGKYAYNHRADYHGKSANKRDAVLIFER